MNAVNAANMTTHTYPTRGVFQVLTMTALHFLSDSPEDVICRPSTDFPDRKPALRRKTLSTTRCLPHIEVYSCFSHLYHLLYALLYG